MTHNALHAYKTIIKESIEKINEDIDNPYAIKISEFDKRPLFDTFLTRAKLLNKRIVFPESGDPRILSAASFASRLKVGTPILIGQEKEIRKNGQQYNIIDFDNVQFVDPNSEKMKAQFERYCQSFYEKRKHKGMTIEKARKLLSSDSVLWGNMMVKEGDADAVISGAVTSTADVLRAGLQAIGTAPGVNVISSFFIMSVYNEKIHRVMFFADCAVNPDPDEEQLAQIAASNAQAFYALIERVPTVAMISFSTKSSASHPIVTKIKKAIKILNEIAPWVKVDPYPVQADVAVNPEIARQKAPDSILTQGPADILVFGHGLGAGNPGYKLVNETAPGSLAVGPIIVGGAAPFMDLSRGARPTEIFLTYVLTSIICTIRDNRKIPQILSRKTDPLAQEKLLLYCRVLQESKDEEKRRWAAEQIFHDQHIRKEAFPFLIKALESEKNETVKELIIEALRKIKSLGSVIALIDYIEQTETSSRLRILAMNAVLEMNKAYLPSLLKDILKEPGTITNTAVREHAIKLAGTLRLPELEKALLTIVKDPDEPAFIRSEAVKAISDMISTDVNKTFIALLKELAERVLTNHEIEDVTYELFATQVIEAVANRHKALIPSVSELWTILRSASNSLLSTAAANALFMIGGRLDSEIIAALISALNHENPKVQLYAARLLAREEYQKALAHIIDRAVHRTHIPYLLSDVDREALKILKALQKKLEYRSHMPDDIEEAQMIEKEVRNTLRMFKQGYYKETGYVPSHPISNDETVHDESLVLN